MIIIHKSIVAEWNVGPHNSWHTNLDILGSKFDSRLTFEDHVHGIVSPVSQRIDIWRLVKLVHVDTSELLLRCYYAFVLYPWVFFSCVWVCCWMCIRWPGFALIRDSCRCIIYVMLLHCVCCIRLIRTRIVVCSVIFHLIVSEFVIPELLLQLIQLSLKYQGVTRPNMQFVCKV